MARRAKDLELDPVVIPIVDDEVAISMDEWLAGLVGDEPTELRSSAADLLAEARAEQE